MTSVHRRRRVPAQAPDAGVVTVEFAVGFFAVAIMVALIIGVFGAGMTQAELCQAVREGARSASLGHADPASVVELSFQGPIEVSVSGHGQWITVHARARGGGLGGWLGGGAQCEVSTLAEEGAR